jgi:hypothetical protein
MGHAFLVSSPDIPVNVWSSGHKIGWLFRFEQYLGVWPMGNRNDQTIVLAACSIDSRWSEKTACAPIGYSLHRKSLWNAWRSNFLNFN